MLRQGHNPFSHPFPMKAPSPFLFASALPILSVFPGHKAEAEITVNAEVLSSNTTTSTVRFTFRGDLATLSPKVNLQSFLFIDISKSPALEAALPNSVNLTNFNSNSVGSGTSGSINTVEVRNNEGYYFDRISFVFDSALNDATSMTEGSVLEMEFPTSSIITTADFSNLELYWCFPDWGTNEGRGTAAGLVNPTSPEPSGERIKIGKNESGQLVVEFEGVLESTPSLLSPFTPVAGATSPFTVPMDSPSTLFFRVTFD